MTIDQAKYFSDIEIIEYLKQLWKIKSNEPIRVTGKIYLSINSHAYDLYVLKDVVLDENKIEYPTEVLSTAQHEIQRNGIFITINKEKIENFIKDNKPTVVSCELKLAPKTERIKHDNPFELNVALDSIEVLDVLDEKIIFLETIEYENIKYTKINALNYLKKIYEEETRSYIDHALEKKLAIDKELKNLRHTIEKEEEKLNNIENIFSKKLEESNQKINKEIDRKKEEYNLIEEAFSKKYEGEKEKYNTAVVILNKDIESKKEEKEKYITEIKVIKDDIELKKNEILILIEEIEQLKEMSKEEKELMSKKLEKLREFIKDKADTLLDLEFIDKEEYNELLMIREENEDDSKFVDFTKDLNGDMQKLISHIQAYLFEQDIVYPRYILEDFLALIKTNDLIVLAGESGSGKTNLIKSFAQAIGGKSFIIPVKPNWTSSEDLLGYYNPLEKKYLSTPFLEALLEAKDNPDVPYFICLDEMNLARVEYYFADFLSLLEERGNQPEIKLYSEDESSHILSEFKNVMDTIEHVKEKYKKKNIVNFVKLLQDEDINSELTRIFGFSDKDSLIKYHTDLRRMLSGILNTPSSINFPKNVRIIGAINIDETTHYLSPKILDRAHIMKFDSPLLQDWDRIADEIEDIENKEFKIKINIEDLGIREPYPSFDRNDEFCKVFTYMAQEYFSPLGIEVGLRTIRQGLNYQKIFIEQGSNKDLVMNNIMLHKILPKMTFDGKKKVGEVFKNDLLLQFKEYLKDYIDQDLAKSQSIDAIDELEEIIKVSDSNDGIVNYWA